MRSNPCRFESDRPYQTLHRQWTARDPADDATLWLPVPMRRNVGRRSFVCEDSAALLRRFPCCQVCGCEDMGLAPCLQRQDDRLQCAAERGQALFDLWEDLGEDLAVHELPPAGLRSTGPAAFGGGAAGRRRGDPHHPHADPWPDECHEPPAPMRWLKPGTAEARSSSRVSTAERIARWRGDRRCPSAGPQIEIGRRLSRAMKFWIWRTI